MTGKQKRFLRTMASTMPAVVQIGKNGLEQNVVDSAKAVIAARELIKVKILSNCEGEKREIFEKLAQKIDAELVQVIGHNAVYYRAKEEPVIELP